MLDMTWLDDVKQTAPKEKIIEFLDGAVKAYSDELVILMSKLKSKDDHDFIINILEKDLKSIYSCIQEILTYIKINKGIDLLSDQSPTENKV